MQASQRYISSGPTAAARNADEPKVGRGRRRQRGDEEDAARSDSEREKADDSGTAAAAAASATNMMREAQAESDSEGRAAASNSSGGHRGSDDARDHHRRAASAAAASGSSTATGLSSLQVLNGRIRVKQQRHAQPCLVLADNTELQIPEATIEQLEEALQSLPLDRAQMRAARQRLTDHISILRARKERSEGEHRVRRRAQQFSPSTK